MAKNDIIEQLNIVLADTYTLYLKTQNYHWHVEGPEFYSLHLLLETQYEDLGDAVDMIAERMRALDSKAPATFKEFLQLTNIKEGNSSLSHKEMLKDLAKDQEIIIKTLYQALKVADDAGDEGTVDMYIERIRQHEKNRWMLTATVK